MSEDKVTISAEAKIAEIINQRDKEVMIYCGEIEDTEYESKAEGELKTVQDVAKEIIALPEIIIADEVAEGHFIKRNCPDSGRHKDLTCKCQGAGYTLEPAKVHEVLNPAIETVRGK